MSQWLVVSEILALVELISLEEARLFLGHTAIKSNTADTCFLKSYLDVIQKARKLTEHQTLVQGVEISQEFHQVIDLGGFDGFNIGRLDVLRFIWRKLEQGLGSDCVSADWASGCLD